MQKTIIHTGKADRKWWFVDARDRELGRLASRISVLLQGKHKETYTPFLDIGDFVIVINSDKIKLTGNKWKNKQYYHHSGYPGGLKVERALDVLNKNPERLLLIAVRKMLPKNKLARKMLKRLKVYRGEEHPHSAQKPAALNFDSLK